MMNRTSKYYYDENEKLTRMETYETYEKGDLCEGCEGCNEGDEGVTLEDSVELPCETISPLGMAAVALSAIGLGVSIARLLRDGISKEEG